MIVTMPEDIKTYTKVFFCFSIFTPKTSLGSGGCNQSNLSSLFANAKIVKLFCPNDNRLRNCKKKR